MGPARVACRPTTPILPSNRMQSSAILCNSRLHPNGVAELCRTLRSIALFCTVCRQPWLQKWVPSVYDENVGRRGLIRTCYTNLAGGSVADPVVRRANCQGIIWRQERNRLALPIIDGKQHTAAEIDRAKIAHPSLSSPLDEPCREAFLRRRPRAARPCGRGSRPRNGFVPIVGLISQHEA